MSKVKSAVGSNQKTLLSFFNKSTSTTPITLPNNSTPRDDKCISHTPVATITSARSDITTGATSCSPDEFSAVVTNKRRRVLAVDDDEEEVEREVNVKPTKRSVMSTPMSDNEEWSEEGLEDSDDEEEDLGGTLGNANKKLRANIPRPPRPLISQNESQKVVIKREIDSCLMSPHTYTPVSAVVRKELTSSNSPEEEDRRMLPDGVSAMGSHEHHAWPFLKPANRKDKSGRGPTDPLYNARTLHVPVKFLNDLTPAMQQWMDFKMDNMDTVLFFKVGKFYELYHMDADVGMSELDLIFMKGSKAHSGFPEVSYGKYANILVNKGYKVARIEQTETPDMLRERNESASGRGGKKDKVVRREMCSILSKGTRTFCHLDEGFPCDDVGGAPMSVLLCVIEKQVNCELSIDAEDAPSHFIEYGVCTVDTILGAITLAQFQDDRQLSRLRTLLARYQPTEAVLEREASCSATSATIALLAPSAILELFSAQEMPSVEDTLQLLSADDYYEGGDTPEILRAVIAGCYDGSSSLALRALGGALTQLKRSCIDYEIMSAGKVSAYVPTDMETSQPTDMMGLKNRSTGKHMILDAVALANLEVLVNNFDRTEKGSLWSFINRTKTSFGKRLLREWLCKPLLSIEGIDRRRCAVQELLELETEADKVRALLRKLPDVERLLSRVHCNGLAKRSTTHPDSRAVMFEPSIYNNRKIRDFADLLNSFEQILGAIKILEDVDLSSPYLINIAQGSIKGSFPSHEMSTLLKYFREIFDEKAAKKDGTITPKPGVNVVYDAGVADVKRCMSELESHLREAKRITGLSSLTFWGNNKDRFQIEVPIGCVNKVPSDWTCKSQKKSHRRYHTPTIEHYFKQLQDAEARIAMAQKDTLRSIFERFDQKSLVWFKAVQCVSELDALLALAAVSSAPGYCWPEMLQSMTPVLAVVEGRHPMLDQALAERGDGDYIPNTVRLGSESVGNKARMMLVSGPNMGGKSTLLRQTCLISILAQLGCKVPAQSCALTPIDRIFTRVGASDRILSGQSTFFVELAETAAILLHATQDSLCILDELGRGTATFDGTAIAHGVVDYLVNTVACRSMFATHYHSLVDDWEMDPRVRLGHMDCIVQTRGTTINTDADPESVTFLYKLCDGSSPRSYGINVAKLANLPDTVVQLAIQHSREYERQLGGGSMAGSARDVYVKYFERLASIVRTIDGSFTDEEFIFFVGELWRRLSHTLTLQNSDQT